MSVLTNDNRFEEAANAVVEGDEVNNMCDVLDRVEKRGELRGEKRGELRGEKKGELRGEKKGELKKAKEISRNMKTRGLSNRDISDLTGIDIKLLDDWFPGDLVIL